MVGVQSWPNICRVRSSIQHYFNSFLNAEPHPIYRKGFVPEVLVSNTPNVIVNYWKVHFAVGIPRDNPLVDPTYESDFV